MKIRPAIFVPAILILLLLYVLVALGFWQLGRAEQKRQIVEQVNFANRQPPISIYEPDQLIYQAHKKVLLTGKYLGDKQFIYDNQTANGVAGYYVLTPFQIKNSPEIVLVNRGFIAWGNKRTIADISLGKQLRTIQAKVDIPIKRFELKPSKLGSHFPLVIQSLDLPLMAMVLKTPLIPVIMQLDSAQTDGYLRQWRPFYGISADKHTAYAVQWFAMAFALFLIALFLLTKTIKKQS